MGERVADPAREPDAVLVVHHHDAFAQVLHDVLRELCQVREVDLLPAHMCPFVMQPMPLHVLGPDGDVVERWEPVLLRDTPPSEPQESRP